MNDLATRLDTILNDIAAQATIAEQLCRVPDENMRLLRGIGFFRALQPEAFGGDERPVHEYAECVVKLAEACASTAWTSSLLANHSHAIALFSPALQEEVWGSDPDALVCSAVAPLGKWKAEAGGIRLSGRFPWSSGCDHAAWAVLGYLGENNMGQPGPCFAVVPRKDFAILDDWDAAALRGTGSKTLVVEDAFVPEHRCESLFALNYGLTRGFGSNLGSLFYLPFSPVFSMGFSAVAVGIARRACAVFTDITKKRIRAYTGVKSVETTAPQLRLAESVNQTTCALELLRRDWREMSKRANEHKVPPADDVLLWRTHQAYATRLAIEAVSRLMAGAGGRAWFAASEMQRLFRDVNITGSHAQTDYDVAAVTFGRHLLGLAPDAKHY